MFCKTWVHAILLCTLIPLPSVFAQNVHVVSPADLAAKANAPSQTRAQNEKKVREFLSSPAASEAMRKAHIDSGQVKQAIGQLDDQELAQLAARADQAQKDFAAGNLSTHTIALIILAVAVLILIIIVAR